MRFDEVMLEILDVCHIRMSSIFLSRRLKKKNKIHPIKSDIKMTKMLEFL